MNRPIDEYVKYGVINLDKPSNPSSHEVVTWVKNILEKEPSFQITKTGHSGTLDPKVSGCLLVCVERATRLVKSQQELGKEYVAVLKLADAPKDEDHLRKTINEFTGSLFQRPPLESAVKRQLRIRRIHESELLEFDQEKNMAVIRVSCEAGTYIRTLCEHLGFHLGTIGEMAELRRIRSGNMTENAHLYTMHHLLDAMYLYQTQKDESYLRNVVKPLEYLLTDYKRIVVKDTAVGAICYGAQLTLPGILRYEENIETGDAVVLMTTKGEAVAIANSIMTSEQIALNDYGMVTKTKRVIMERNTYPQRWGLGQIASEKKRLIEEGKLNQDGTTNEATPESWKNRFCDTAGKEWFYQNKSKLLEEIGQEKKVKKAIKKQKIEKTKAAEKKKPAEKESISAESSDSSSSDSSDSSSESENSESSSDSSSSSGSSSSESDKPVSKKRKRQDSTSKSSKRRRK